MRDLIVVGFHERYRAADVLTQLRRMEWDWVIDLDDAVAVYRDVNGKLRIEQSVEPTSGEGAAWGALWGSLIGAILALPFTAGASAPAAGAAVVGIGALSGGTLGAASGLIDASWWKEDFGISEDFVNAVSTMLRPGDSAIFALIRSGNPEEIAKHFRGYGGTILRTSLTPAQAAKVEDVLHARPAA
jgi:uncharacterized membrane protein